jgi:asparagine synthase (glutamine-hydrolysing)
MCGICGRFNLDGRPVSADEITAMRDVMVHRGPDGEGIFVDGAVGLGHRRLSIIDLEGGHQPLSNEDGNVTVVFNGEIYNFRELRPGLEARGHTLATKSDTEVIVHSYEESGADCVDRFRGMFAFALWDRRRRQLLLARDRLGVKPLYYVQVGDSLLFASEIKSLLQSPDVRPELDPSGLRRYLAYRHSYGDGTLLKGIRQLPPGHVLIANSSGITIRRYWDVPNGSSAAVPERAADDFLAALDHSVVLRMISDVPLGAFLSGGLDSSVVTALMARHTDKVSTFSIGFVPGEENELQWARLVAERFGAEHHQFVLESRDFFDLLQRLVWHHDEPMMFPASIPLYLLCRESKPIATVMLAGEGADEILAGYGNNIRLNRLAGLAARLPRLARKLVSSVPLTGRPRAIASRLALSDHDLIVDGYRLGGWEALAAACRVSLPGAAEDDRRLSAELGFGQRRGTFLDRLLYFQLKTYLVALLMKQDKMSMAASIETRVPYLDHELVSMAFSLPDKLKIQNGRGKQLLRRVARGLLPDGVIDRPKQGFPVPIARWFREPKSPFIDVLLDPESLRDGLLDAAFVRERVKRFLAGQRNSMELWALMNLELWRRNFLAPARQMRPAA